MLDHNISKEIEFNHRRKVAHLRSDHQFQLSEGVSASLPYYFMEGEVQHNIHKIVGRMSELGYQALIFGDRNEPQRKCAGGAPLVFERLATEHVEVILKIRFQNALLEMLKNRKYLVDDSERDVVLGLLRGISLPHVKGLYWTAVPIPPALLHREEFRGWTRGEILLQEVQLMEAAFAGIELLFVETAYDLPFSEELRTVAVISRYAGNPWEEFRPPNPQLKISNRGYRHAMVMHNKGFLGMGEGLWPLQGEFSSVNLPESYWGDCDLYNQFPEDNRLSTNWGLLGMEARLLWLKMLQAKEKPVHRVQLDSWNHQLRELELRSEENPLIRHFIADAWCFLYVLQSQPIPQGVGQGGFWKGRPLEQEPLSDGSPWFNSSRMV